MANKTKTIKTTFLLRRGSSSEWARINPILKTGEPGFEIDTGILKIGNGLTSWNNLPVFITEDNVSNILADPENAFTQAIENAVNNKIDEKAAVLHFCGEANPVRDPENASRIVALTKDAAITDLENDIVDPENGHIYEIDGQDYVYNETDDSWTPIIDPVPGEVYLVTGIEYVYDLEEELWIPLGDSEYNRADLVTADELKNYLTVNELTLDKIKQKDEDHDYVIWNCGNALSNNFIDMTTDERVPRVGTLEVDNENAPLLY